MYNKEFSQKGREGVLYFSLSRFLTNLSLIYAHKCWALFLVQSFKLLPTRKAMNAVLGFGTIQHAWPIRFLESNRLGGYKGLFFSLDLSSIKINKLESQGRYRICHFRVNMMLTIKQSGWKDNFPVAGTDSVTFKWLVEFRQQAKEYSTLAVMVVSSADKHF